MLAKRVLVRTCTSYLTKRCCEQRVSIISQNVTSPVFRSVSTSASVSSSATSGSTGSPGQRQGCASSYKRGTNNEAAKDFLKSYHEKTVARFGGGGSEESAKPGKSSQPEHQGQVRRVPEFLKRAIMYKDRSYFCHTHPKTGSRVLVRFRMSPREEVVMATLDSQGEVVEVQGRGEFLAVMVASDDCSTAYIIEERSGELVRVLEGAHQLHWTTERCVLYTTINNRLRPDAVMMVPDITSNTSLPELVHRSEAEDEVMSVTVAKDGHYAMLNANTKLHSQVWVARVGDIAPGNFGTPVCTMEKGVKCYVEHHRGNLVALASSPSKPDLQLHWTPLDDDVSLCDDVTKWNVVAIDDVIHEIEVFDRGIVLFCTHKDSGCYRLLLLDPHDYNTTLSTIEFPPDVSLVTPNNNLSSDQSHLHIQIHSLSKPTKQLSVPLKRFAVSRGRLMSRGRYDVTRRQVLSAGGALVPVTIVGSEEVIDELSPCLFMVYGCYGTPLSLSYDTLPHELLAAGWKVVLCHVRGGGEQGRGWYTQGIGEGKKLSILDTLNCLRHCHTTELSTPSSSTLQSLSAGSLVAARTVQTKPGIVSKLVLQLPFLDSSTALSSPSLPLTPEERVEWSGEECAVSRATTDLDCDVYVTVGGRDRRAPAWHTANFVAALPDPERVWVNLVEGADHGGFDEAASRMEVNFVRDQMSKKKPSREEGSGVWNQLLRLFSK